MFSIDNLDTIITAIALTATTITFLIKMIEAIKNKNTLQKNINLFEVMKDYIKEAEILISKGSDKKEYVLNKIFEYAKYKNIIYDDKLMSEKIDEYIKFSKDVNFTKN